MNVFRAALARDFWITGIAIARYMPRAFRVKQVDGNQFFTEEKRQEYPPARGKCAARFEASVGDGGS